MSDLESIPAPFAIEPIKPPMPDFLRTLAEDAIKRHRKRVPHAPALSRTEERGVPAGLLCPFRDADRDLWLAMLLECFGTRIYSVAESFMRQLASLIPLVVYEDERHSRPDEEALNQALAIVYALKPRNEAEAAHAAQLAAVFLASMRVGEHVGRSRGYLDPKTAASMALLTRTYGAGLETMRKLKGRGNGTIRQNIRVERHVHHHQHEERHVHVKGGGGQRGESRADATARPRAREAVLRSQDEGGRQLQIVPGEGQEALPDARRRERIGRTEG